MGSACGRVRQLILE